MEFKITETVGFPVDEVYRTYRDRLHELVPYLPNVDSIDVLERTETEGGVKLVNRWTVGDAVPRAVRPFLSAKMLTYLDHATWIDDATRVDWIFEIGVVPDAVDCRGSNYFNVGAAPGTTEVALTGIIAIDLSRVRGVPRLFHGLAPRVEGYLIERVRPNLVAVARAVGQLLEAERRPG